MIGLGKPPCARCFGRLIDPAGTPGDSMCACRACNGTGFADDEDLTRATAEVATEHAGARADAWWRP